MVQSRDGLPRFVRQGFVFLALIGLVSPRPSPAGDDLPPPSDQELVVADVDCPVASAPAHGGRYPNVHGLDREARSPFARTSEPAKPGAPYAVTRAYRNPVDQEIFGQLAASGIQPTVRSSDAEFLRRVMLDLTGRVPAPADVLAFVSDPRGDKRGRLVDTLLASDAFVDKWALWFGDLVENVRTTTANGVEQGPGRNAFYAWSRAQLAAAVPYDQMVRDVVSATGDSFGTGPANFIVRNLTTMGVTQDNYDNWAATASEKFLAVPLNCSGCHNGAGHSPNLYVQSKTRMDFWKNAAFFAQTTYARSTDAATNLSKYTIGNNTTGSYKLNTTTGNRPARQPATGQTNVVDPAFYLTGEKPAAGKPLRTEYARMLTSHPQFARATVNYLFKEMFGIGIVDPPDQFDLFLQDPANLPPGQAPQPSHPALLTRLQNAFVASGYDLRSTLRTIANSEAYQLSARYTPGAWNETWTRTFARHFTRRVPAEALLDAVTAVSGVPVNLTVNSSTPVGRAMLLPDPTEGGGGPSTFMNYFLRGNRDTNPRSGDVSTIQALALMNDGTVVSRVQNATQASLVSRTLKATQKPDEIVDTLWLATLARVPTAAEKASAVAYLKTATPTSPLAAKTENLQWTLFNKLEFLFY